MTSKPKRRPRPQRALDTTERERVLSALHCERFVDKAPAQVWATLLDEGIYHCSIRTMYRILSEHGEVRERRNQLRHPNYQKPELVAEDYVEPAMLCESARWGDASPGRENRPRTRDVHWKRARDYVLDLMDGNVERFIRALRDHDYYPTLDPPVFERVADSITIRRSAEAERVHYTLDGSDPRNPTAHSFSEAVSTIPFSPNLKGRSRRGDEWSALNEYGTWERD